MDDESHRFLSPEMLRMPSMNVSYSGGYNSMQGDMGVEQWGDHSVAVWLVGHLNGCS